MSNLNKNQVNNATLFVVATPIGNLDDITFRALQVLKNVDMIAAEDTRQTRKLLSHFNILGKHVIPYHDHGESAAAERIVQMMLNKNISLALVSDAGTPCISDPGYRLVRLAHEKNIPVHPLPGCSSITTIISVSGLATHKWSFVGFLPTKKNDFEAEVLTWQQKSGESVVFLESMRRLSATLSQIHAHYPNAQIIVGREMTKLHEEFFRGSVTEALEWYEALEVKKGEVTAMIQIPEVDSATSVDNLFELMKVEFERGATLKDLLIKYKTSLPKKELYQLLLKAKA